MYRLIAFIVLFLSIHLLMAQDTSCVEFNANFQTEDYAIQSFEQLVCPEKTEKYSVLNFFSENNDNIFFWWLLLFISIAVIFLWNIERLHSIQLLKSILSVNYMLQISRGNKVKEQFFGSLFTLSFFILSSIAFCKFFQLNFHHEIEWYYFTFFFFAIILFEALTLNIIGYLMKANHLVIAQRLNSDSVVLLGSILTLPMVFVILFSTFIAQFFFSWIFIVVFLLLYVIKEVRSLQLLNSFRIKIFNFYFFIYLCTFKILPILVLGKIFYSYIFI